MIRAHDVLSRPHPRSELTRLLLAAGQTVLLLIGLALVLLAVEAWGGPFTP